MVDNNNIFVFIKDVNTEKWSEWKEISSLYLSDNISNYFEKRVNEYGHHEIKFGDDINGKRLNSGDTIAIYYLESDGNSGIVGIDASKSGKILPYISDLHLEIQNNIKDPNVNYLSKDYALALKFENEYPSIPPTALETVSDIRKNAPLLFSAQNRAVTVYDYETYVYKNFSNIIQSVKAVSNKQYTAEYLAYYYELGLQRPNLDDKMLFNQVSFNDSCDFNNVYLFCVPRLGAIKDETTPIDLFFSQKQAVVEKLAEVKMLNHNVVVNDPVYLAFDIGLPILGESVTSTIKDETIVRVTRNTTQMISKDQIKNSIYSLIKEFFLQSNNSLEQTLDLNELSFNILRIEGIKSLETVRISNGVEYKTSKINFIYWNPLYSNTNVNSTSQNIKLKFFEFPFFYKITNLINKIEVI